MAQIDTTVSLFPFCETEIPALPGVYLFLDDKDSILYIGKAKNLRNRIITYIRGGDSRMQLPFLMNEAVSVRVVVTTSEREALVLEARLIENEQPPYNIDLLNEGRYPYIAVTDEQWPALVVIRHSNRRYRRIIGPFTDVSKMRRMVRVLTEIYGLRSCKTMSSSGCVNYQIGRCSAPCLSKITRQEYERRITEVIGILSGKQQRELADYLKHEMLSAARRLHFERAAVLRDAMEQLPILRDSLGISLPGEQSGDLFLFAFHHPVFVLSVARFVEGKLLQLFHFTDKYYTSEQSAAIQAVVAFYRNRALPDSVMISSPVSVYREFSELFPSVPLKRRIPKEILDVVLQNQHKALEQWLRRRENVREQLEELGRFVGRVPLSIACVDISTFGGEQTVASMVWWEDGVFVKKRYRRFRIKTVEGQDDFGSLKEVAQRLEQRWNSGTWPRPHLFLVDGGSPQLRAVLPVLADTMSVAGIVKDRKKERGFEFLVNPSGERLPLSASPLSLLVAAIRDEAHRTAILYNRLLRKEKTATGLSAVPGIGVEREKKLLAYFGSFSAIRKADKELLSQVPGISRRMADKIFTALHGDKT